MDEENLGFFDDEDISIVVDSAHAGAVGFWRVHGEPGQVLREVAAMTGGGFSPMPHVGGAVRRRWRRATARQ